MTRLLALLLVAASLLSVAPATADAPGAIGAIGACTDGGPRPCVVSALRNGEPLGPDRTFDASATAEQVSFEALGELDPADVWQVTLDLGTIVPRAVTGAARDVTVERAGTTVTVTGRPLGRFAVTVSVRPVVPGGTGLDLFTDLAAATPRVRDGGLRIVMAGQSTGHLEVRLPDAFLREVYGVPDPELMTTRSLRAESGSGTVAVVRDGDAMRVAVDGVTSYRQVLEIRRGVIVPTRPGNFITHRISPSSSELFFTNAEARGAQVHGHEARCTPARGHQPVVTERGWAPIIIDGLTPGTTYDCHVRGLSKAGPGPWSTAMRT